MGRPGSRSSELHNPSPGFDGGSSIPQPSYRERDRFFILRWLGALGACLIALGGLGGGALPVVDNPWFAFPFGATMSRMMLASNAIVLIGVGMLVASWLIMAPFVGAGGHAPRIGAPALQRTFVAWVLSLIHI